MPRVRKPCPGCQGTDSIRKSADTVCNDCARLLQLAKDRLAEDAARDTGEITVLTKERYYALPACYPAEGSIEHDNHDRLKKALHSLIWSLSRPCREHSNEEHLEVPTWTDSSRDWGIYRTMRRDQAEMIVALDAAIRAAVDDVSASAYEKGRNLLMSIAEGRVSMDEMNERSIGSIGSRGSTKRSR